VSLFAPLPTTPGGFACILADPPWKFASNSDPNPQRNARRHYRCLPQADLATLPLEDAAAKDSFLFLWVPTAFLVRGDHLPLMKAWGSSRPRSPSHG
jgi:N6-adenosine-specific RNA methylase IME4